MSLLTSAEYKCLDCGDKFENVIQCIVHLLRWKHEQYRLGDSDIIYVIKNPNNVKEF